MNAPEDKQITFMEIRQNSSQAQEMKPQMTGLEHVETGSLDKIRDILFGNQMRDYEKRFARLEERLIKENADLREENRKRLDTIENYIRNEIDTITERINNEPTARDEAVSQLNLELKTLINTLEKKIIQLDQQTNQSQREIRQQILEQSKTLDHEIRQNSAEILTTLEQEAQRLRNDKTDRSVLATLFAELAVRLSNS
jgi:DNA repair exonuclease SbcCD ATPase subunit